MEKEREGERVEERERERERGQGSNSFRERTRTREIAKESNRCHAVATVSSLCRLTHRLGSLLCEC